MLKHIEYFGRKSAMIIRRSFLLVIIFGLINLQHLFARQFFVSSISGSDSYNGTSENKPWKTLKPVNGTVFLPGDTINFSAGSVWDTGIEITSNGTRQLPIVFRAYGTGAKPVITKVGKMTRAINIKASWIIVEGLFAKDVNHAGINLEKGADHNIIRGCEMMNCGGGVMISGRYNLVTENYAHDLVMIKNTQGAKGTKEGDDDYGAVAFWVFNSNNEICYNRAIRCRAASYDYGSDGGFFEVYSNGDSTYVHHNYAEDCNGFLEIGGGTAKDIIVSHNISLNNGEFCFHLGKNFRADIQNFRLEHNTIITRGGTKWNAILDWAGGLPTNNTLLMKNNMIVLGGEAAERISKSGDFIHQDNIYFLQDGAQIGYTLQKGESVNRIN